MAVYRQIHVSFWQDEFVLDLEPDEKYFYLYLMTNSKTTQCGIYELPKKLMVLELGYPIDTVSILLQNFIDRGKILYSDSTREIFILNWLKHNSIKSPKVFACVEKELKSVKDKGFLYIFGKKCEEYSYPIPTVCKDYGEEKEKEEEKEEEKEQQEEQPPQPNVINDYEKNFGIATPTQMEKLWKWVDDFNKNQDIIKKAIEETALVNPGHPFPYMESILKTWSKHKATSLEQVQAIQLKYANDKQNRTGKGKIVREEIKPDWFGKEQDKPQEPENDPELEERKRAIAERLKNLRNKEEN